MTKAHHPRIIILFLLVLGLSFATHFVSASPTYLPGVKSGDWTYYGTVSSTFESNNPYAQPPDLLTAKTVNMTVQGIQGSIVTVQQTILLGNQTYANVRTLTGNLSSGEGDLAYWLIAGGLVKGDRLYQGASPLAPMPVINETVPKVYAGAVRLVNILNDSLTVPSPGTTASFHISLNLTAAYDQQTGVLLELTQNEFSSYEFPGAPAIYSKSDLHILVMSTSLWKGSTSPGFVIESNTTSIIIGQNSNMPVQLTVFSLNGFQGTVTFSTHVSSQGPDATVVPGSVTLTADGSAHAVLTIVGHGTPIGHYDVNVTGTAGQAATTSIETTRVTVQLPDFSLFIPRSSVTIVSAGGFVEDAFLQSIAGFRDTVTLSSTSTPTGLRAVFEMPSVMVDPTGLNGDPLSIMPAIGMTSAAPGNYVLSISATSGSIVHIVQVNVNVVTEFPGFNITASPASLDIPQGGMVTSLVMIHALDAYDPTLPTVTLDITVSPVGPNVSIFPPLINLFTPIGSTTMTVSVPQSTPVGVYKVSVNATYNGFHHSATVTVNVRAQASTSPDFTLSLDPTSRTITQGGSTTILVRAHGQYGFTDTIQFTSVLTASTSVPTRSFDPASVALSSSYPDGSVVLRVSAPVSLAPGNYKIEIYGTSSGRSHTVEATIIVQSNSQGAASNPSVFGLSMPVFYGIIAGVVAVVAAIGLIAYSRTRSRAIVP